jgi:UDP-N-acetylglucosamine acyltransferase
MRCQVHPTAVVHSGAELGEDVIVGPYCVVGDKVCLGDGTHLHNHVTVQGPTTVGRENMVYPFAVLGAEPQDLKFQGLDTELVIGDRNRIREHATIHRGTELGGFRTSIGNDCMIMVAVHIAHDCTIEDDVVIANNSMLGGHCLIECGANIAGGVGIHHFATVSGLSFVGGMSRIVKDVPPFIVVEGSPAEPRRINTTGLMRRGWSPEEIEVLRRAFRMIYRAPEVTAMEAVEVLRLTHGARGGGDLGRADQGVLDLCTFVERCEAGIHGRYLEMDRPERRDRAR